MENSTPKFITECIDREVKARLAWHPTQGLIARIMRNADVSPADLGRGGGYRKIITGLSCTHTMKVYLDQEYRVLIHWKWARGIEVPTEEEWKKAIKDKRITHNRLPWLLECAWCKEEGHSKTGEVKKEQPWPKGNRRHLFFFCNHPVLTEFRTVMGRMLEAKLVQMFLFLSEARTGQGGLHLLNAVEGTLLQLSSEEVGRLEKWPKGEQKNYMTITEWCEYLGVANVVEGVNKGARVMSHVFGFETGKGDGEVEDRHAGSVDAMYLGVVPKRLHESIGRCFRRCLAMEERLGRHRGW